MKNILVESTRGIVAERFVERRWNARLVEKKKKKEKENTENIANTLEEESKGRWSFRNEAKAVYHFPINQSVNRLYASR